MIYPDKDYPLDRDEVSVIYLKESSINWNGIDSLAGSRVGWQRGYGYKKYIDADFLHYEVSNSAQAIAMIRLERLDFSWTPRQKSKIYSIAHTMSKIIITKRISLKLTCFRPFEPMRKVEI